MTYSSSLSEQLESFWKVSMAKNAAWLDKRSEENRIVKSGADIALP